MIVVRITHGLGNQLFQYAVARGLSIKLNSELIFDISHYKHNAKRDFELSYFNYPSKVDTNLDSFVNESFNFHMQPAFQFDKAINNISANTYISGFWQNEGYFAEYRDLLLKDLTIKSEFVKGVKHKSIQLQRENSVFVHVRRGDYLSNEYSTIFGALTTQYYSAALKHLERKIGKYKVYLFSDDIEWVKNNIVLDCEYEFISGIYTTTNIEDFFLMASCRHSIIANSSFSWWAAWLSKVKDKIVIAPKKWFNNEALNRDQTVPKNWIQI